MRPSQESFKTERSSFPKTSHAPRPSRWEAVDILHRTFSRHAPDSSIDIGRLVCLGEGLSRVAYAAHVEVHPDPRALSGKYVALLSTPNADKNVGDGFSVEAKVLAHLQTMQCPFRIPRVLGLYVDDESAAVVQSYLDGYNLDLRHGRQPSVIPWEVVGNVAAGVHALPPPRGLHGFETGRAHAEAAIARDLADGEPEVLAARDWALAHLPPAHPSVLLHGDLLGQNILIAIDDAPGLIDWEYAKRGDPAYDLAIVTRGVRRPFQTQGGLTKLLDAYVRAGGTEITEAQVRLYELCHLGGAFRAARPRRPVDGTADEILRQLGNLVQRL